MNHEHQPAAGEPDDSPPPEHHETAVRDSTPEDHPAASANRDAPASETETAETEPGAPTAIERLADPPRIWVGSWLDYNNGVLHGQWIDAARADDEVWADIEAMLASSPSARQQGEIAEDWGIFDHENFGPLKVGEQETVSFVTAAARGIAEHGPAFAAWADVMEDEAALASFTDAYLGEYDSLEAYAEQLIDDLGYNRLLDEVLPEHVRRYVEFNTAGLAQDMWLSGDVHVYHRDGGGVWLFNGR